MTKEDCQSIQFQHSISLEVGFFLTNNSFSKIALYDYKITNSIKNWNLSETEQWKPISRTSLKNKNK